MPKQIPIYSDGSFGLYIVSPVIALSYASTYARINSIIVQSGYKMESCYPLLSRSEYATLSKEVNGLKLISADQIRNRLRQKEVWLAYIQIFLGCVLGGAAYPLFLTPNNIAPGGITGIAIILNYLFALPVGTVTLILNIPLFIAGYRTMGRVFAFRSLVATFVFSMMIDILPLQPMTKDPLLSTLFGGVLLGIGLGMILRGGATTGGTDMLARMVHRRFQFISTATFVFAFDAVVVASAGVVMGATEGL